MLLTTVPLCVWTATVVVPVKEAKAEVAPTVKVKELPGENVPLSPDTVPVKACSFSLILSAETDVLVLVASFSLSTSTRSALPM